jgi:toxin-antitoxin system PIN domain toxin
VTYLLDVNVLIALIDTRHLHHHAAHDWFVQGAHVSWATCPITENGVVRIVGHQNYPNGSGSPLNVAAAMSCLRSMPGHVFWPDDISLFDGDRFEVPRLTTTRHLTDSYLLGLAVRNGGRFATFDRRVSTAAVIGGDQALHVI